MFQYGCVISIIKCTFRKILEKLLAGEQRHAISSIHKQDCTQKQIAEAIGKDKSVISIELKRNATPKGKYFICIRPGDG